MTKDEDSDIDRLADKIKVDDLSYKNIHEDEVKLQKLQSWPLYKENLELINEHNADDEGQLLDHLKVIR